MFDHKKTAVAIGALVLAGTLSFAGIQPAPQTANIVDTATHRSGSSVIPRIRLGISSCLLGEAGQSSRDDPALLPEPLTFDRSDDVDPSLRAQV